MSETKPRATVVDVARAAGVALGTVSRVLNNHPEVNEEMRRRVLKSAQDLNYTRIRRRRVAAVTGNGESGDHRPGNMAIVCFGMDDTLVHLPVISTALQGIESALSVQHRDLMIANIPQGDRVPSFLRDSRVEGLILKGPNQGMLPALQESDLLRHIYRVPRVWLMGRLPNAVGDHCNFDTHLAGRLVAEHLQEKGHVRVAFFNPKPGQVQFERLKISFMGEAADLGLEPSLLASPAPKHLVWPLPAITLEDQVDDLLQRWMKIPARSRPTALFAPSDRTAVQLYAAMSRRGLRAAEDVSIISCNNERSLATNLHPTLTSIDVRADFIGRRAVDLLLWRIKHPQEPHQLQMLVDPTLVERDSVAKL